jgi:ABC-type antimicrobial peptide transport system permease subunit
MQIRVLLCLALAAFLGGFFIAAINVDNVLIGVAVIGVGALIALSALIPALKIYQQKKCAAEMEKQP